MVFSNSQKESSFKSKLINNELVVGTWVNVIRDTVISKIIATAGFDYMLVDAEHSGATPSSISDQCMMARECGVYPLVRPFDPNDLKHNGRLLDAGAMGLVVAHIDTAKQAQAIVHSMRYFSGGTRGFGSRTISSSFFKVDEEAMVRSDEQVTCVVQFESVSAIEKADEILSVDGIDVAIIGRGDLAHDMGLSGKATDDRVSYQVEKLFESAVRNNKVCGLLVNDIEDAKKWLNKGIRFLTYGSELGWLLSAYEKGLKEIRKSDKGGE